MDQKISYKERRVLDALGYDKALRWCDMPHAVGYGTLYRMVVKGLIEQVPNGAEPLSREARWRRVPAESDTSLQTNSRQEA